MPQFDTVIKNGTIVDGTKVPRYQADLGIKDGKVAEIGKISSSDGKREIDASGQIVAPGFIDLHTHYDAQLHWDPYCTIGSWHGVTTVTIGNCGFGFAPLRQQDADAGHAGLVPDRSDSAGAHAGVDESGLGDLPAIHGSPVPHAFGRQCFSSLPARSGRGVCDGWL